jgi:hypothetical protein
MYGNSAVCKRAQVLAFGARECNGASYARSHGTICSSFAGLLFAPLSYTYGLAPRAWMVRERVHAAARLLRQTDMTIYQIAPSWATPTSPSFHASSPKSLARAPARIGSGGD